MEIHLWRLAGGVQFDLRKPDPNTMVMDFYLGSIEMASYTELAVKTSKLDHNVLLGIPAQSFSDRIPELIDDTKKQIKRIGAIEQAHGIK